MPVPPPSLVKKIRLALDEADAAKWDEADNRGYPVAVRRKEHFYDPVSVLQSTLNATYLDLRMMAEMMGQTECLADIKTHDAANRSQYGEVRYNVDADYVYAPGLEEAERFFDSLLATVDHFAVGAPFQRIVEATATIVADAGGGAPTSEKEVRDPVFKILKLAYPDTSRTDSIKHPGKNFVPDFSSKDAQSAAEFKFVRNRAGLGPIYDEIAADMLGYSGDASIRSKFALIYLSTAFATQREVDEHFKSVGKPDDWQIIVRHG